MNITEFLLWEQTSRDTIDFKKIYVDITGDLIAGLLLSQIVYWNLPNKAGETKLRIKIDGELWLAKGREDWWEECRITPKQFDRASKILVNKGLIEKQLKKFNGIPTTHIKLNLTTLIECVNSALKIEDTADPLQQEDSLEFTQKVKRDFPKGKNGISPKGKTEFAQKSKPNLPKGENGISPKGKMYFDQKVNSLTENTTEIINREYISENREEKIKEESDTNSVLPFTALNNTVDDNKEHDTEKIILPIEIKSFLSSSCLNRLKAERELYGINLNKPLLYNILLDSAQAALEKDNVELITKDQYAYFMNTLKKKLDVYKTNIKEEQRNEEKCRKIEQAFGY